MKVYLDALGCRLNEAELEQWAVAFKASGASLAGNPGEADVMVLNSCAVTREAVAKSRRRLTRLQRDNPQARLVLSGCYSALESSEALADLGVDLVVGNAEKDKLVKMTVATFETGSMPASATVPDSAALFGRNRHRAFIKIQDGCRYKCTYCIVTVARGEERSRPIAELVDEVQRLAASGVREVVLTGVHVGGYGSDIGLDLADLVTALLDDTDIERIRFASVEPWDLSPRFIALFANARLMPHMHLPLQSGSDVILRRMARRCRTEEFRRLTEKLRAVVPHFNVTTDVIVGFPGESEALWQDSLAFIATQPFGHIHAFAYSAREGTAAANFPDPVPADIQQRRSRELHALAERLKREQLEAQLGQTTRVLWETGKAVPDTPAIRQHQGYTENYHRVEVKSGADIANMIGELAPARVAGLRLVADSAGEPVGETPRLRQHECCKDDQSMESTRRTAASDEPGSRPASMTHRIIPLHPR
ncbi:MAG: tRNA (N(6)-L-threonylcarbamoyladenosine(37)-C(2))-methylthiotransferase MtaB [Gammaproteobacteria bacterium]|nr:MAG: tRNA (N(6)-L-threonylcarbamoyladenosine(37)-C(2))-methylthiotransferase MtaB [Gammaproteobacteria bacterium]